MNYTKPEVAVLGKALGVIENLWAKGYYFVLDIFLPKISLNPAYDLDE